MSKVAIVNRSSQPDHDDVFNMVKESLDLLGGVKSFVSEGQTVALKPNVVTGRVSGPGVITDMRVVEALIHLCYEAGAGRVLVVEGSGYFTPTDIALEKSGYVEMARRAGADVVNVDEDEIVELEVPNPLIVEKIKVSKSFMDADVRINIPVMKTHDQLLVTLGVKNLKGVIPKTMKRRFHAIGVVKGILDLAKVVPIDLTVLDAINAMEGLGPSFGEIVALNALIASRDIYSLDLVASKVMGFEPEELDYLMEADEHGLLDVNADIEVVGTHPEKITRKFKRPPTDLEFGEGISVISEGACSACRGTIHSVVYDIEQMKLMGEIRDLFFVVGPQAEIPEDLPNTPVIMGTCLKRFEGEGCYVEGCPPNNDKMLAAIKEVCSIA